MAEVAAHEEGGGGHEEVQHLSRQHGDEGVLPLQGVEVGQEALSHQRQQRPAGREEDDPLLRQKARQDLGDGKTTDTRPTTDGAGGHAPKPERRCRLCPCFPAPPAETKAAG